MRVLKWASMGFGVLLLLYAVTIPLFTSILPGPERDDACFTERSHGLVRTETNSFPPEVRCIYEDGEVIVRSSSGHMALTALLGLGLLAFAAFLRLEERWASRVGRGKDSSTAHSGR